MAELNLINNDSQYRKRQILQKTQKPMLSARVMDVGQWINDLLKQGFGRKRCQVSPPGSNLRGVPLQPRYINFLSPKLWSNLKAPMVPFNHLPHICYISACFPTCDQKPGTVIPTYEFDIRKTFFSGLSNLAASYVCIDYFYNNRTIRLGPHIRSRSLFNIVKELRAL